MEAGLSKHAYFGAFYSTTGRDFAVERGHIAGGRGSVLSATGGGPSAR